MTGNARDSGQGMPTARRPSVAEVLASLTAGREPDLTRCMYCGWPSPKNNGVCVAHADLGGVK